MQKHTHRLETLDILGIDTSKSKKLEGPVSLDGDLDSLIMELLRKAQMLECEQIFSFCFTVLLLLKLFEIKGQYSAEYNHVQFEPAHLNDGY